MEYNKILFTRLFSSFLWTVALQVFPLSLYILLTNFDVVHPVECLVRSASIVFSIGTWITLVPIHGLLFALSYVLSHEHKKPKHVLTSRFKFLCSFFTKTNVVKLFLYFTLGIVIPWIYLKLNNCMFWTECKESAISSCLNENSVFLVTCGGWTALYYFIRYDILIEKHLQFSVIRQLKFLQIRYKFLTIFHESLILSFVPLFYFLPFYMWYGKSVNLFFEVLFVAPVESSTLTGVFCLLKISVLVNAWVVTVAFFLTVKTLDLMIEIHFTEHFSFALIKQPNVNSVLLATALGEQNLTIIQHLACYDLYILSMSQKSIRWQIFTLSQPGGHPHTWNAILHEALKLMEGFICEIESIYRVPQPEKPKSIPRHVHTRNMTIRHEEIISGPVPLTPVSKFRNLVEHPLKSPVKEQQPSAIDEMRTKLNALVNKIKQNWIVNYIFGLKPDAEIRFLLSNSQPLIWVIQSISELSAHALLEDQFGIVLKDLPLIINTLLRLKCSVDKLGSIQKKFQKRDHDLCMKASLKSALRRSLYTIAIAYSDYLTDLPLTNENLSCMQSYVNFREC